MLIRCPTCASGYDLPRHLLGEGRVLRCARCRDSWIHRASTGRYLDVDDATTVPRPPEIVAEARSGRSAAPPSPRREGGTRRARPRGPRLGASAAGVAALLGLCAGGMAVVAARERVVAAYPPSAAVFAAAGLPVNLRGLSFDGLRSVVATGEGGALLSVEGRIGNLRSRTLELPALRIAVRDASGREIYHWTAPAPRARLAAGETVPFHARLSAPPGDGDSLAITFADAPGRRLAEAPLPAS